MPRTQEKTLHSKQCSAREWVSQTALPLWIYDHTQSEDKTTSTELKELLSILLWKSWGNHCFMPLQNYLKALHEAILSQKFAGMWTKLPMLFNLISVTFSISCNLRLYWLESHFRYTETEVQSVKRLKHFNSSLVAKSVLNLLFLSPKFAFSMSMFYLILLTMCYIYFHILSWRSWLKYFVWRARYKYISILK